ncbi:MAG TPA: ATP-binding protein [Candidatus Nitrosotenuis sp.]|nr:ATP-binding protein [Candidatus Nitrosotenuis sp.]
MRQQPGDYPAVSQEGMDPTEAARAEYERLVSLSAQQLRYIAELEHQLSAYREFQEVTPLFSEAPEVEPIFEKLVSRIAQIMSAEMCVVMLLDETSRLFLAQSPAFGLPPQELRLLRLRPEEGVAGHALAAGVPVSLEGPAVEEGFGRDLARIFRLRSSLTTPLFVQAPDESRVPIGLLHVFNSRSGGFTAEDARILVPLARQATAIIQNTRALASLYGRKAQLETTLSSMLTGVVVLDTGGHIIFCNPVARDILGIGDEEVLGHSVDEAVKLLRLRDFLTQSLKNREKALEEITIMRPEQRHFQVEVAPGEARASNVGLVATFTDITRVRQLERMKTEFVSTVSHELRTPLTSIKGFVSTLLEDTEGHFSLEERREFYQIIDEECDRLTRLITDLLTISRIEAGKSLEMKFTPVDLPRVIERALHAVASQTEIHEFRTQIGSDLPAITADRDKLDQILVNLLGNAVKYAPEGGPITVHAFRQGEQVVLGVEDRGLGIPEEHKHKIFDKFHRVDSTDAREQEGTGIGLYLCKHLVEAHGGRIWFESVVGQGTTFYFSLPIQPTQQRGD